MLKKYICEFKLYFQVLSRIKNSIVEDPIGEKKALAGRENRIGQGQRDEKEQTQGKTTSQKKIIGKYLEH